MNVITPHPTPSRKLHERYYTPPHPTPSPPRGTPAPKGIYINIHTYDHICAERERLYESILYYIEVMCVVIIKTS